MSHRPPHLRGKPGAGASRSLEGLSLPGGHTAPSKLKRLAELDEEGGNRARKRFFIYSKLEKQ